MIDHGKELTKITLMYRRRLTGISRHIAFEWYRCFHLLVMSRPMVQVAEHLLQDRSICLAHSLEYASDCGMMSWDCPFGDFIATSF